MAQINKPTDYFNTKLYTGNGSTQSITGVGFQPDFTWFKRRNGTDTHAVFDIVRGVQQRLITNNNSAEGTQSNGLTSFDSDGFSIGDAGICNTSGGTYASWNWLANGAGVANTDGSISSTVSANTTSGFSIVSYTGNATAGATIGHGLGVVPKFIIVKRIDGASPWHTYHASLGNTQRMSLNETDATSSDITAWNNTTPTSSVFTVGNSGTTNVSGASTLAYCFSEVKGFSKIGSYTGNGSADGTFVYTGFKPAFVLLKRTDSVGNWFVFDNKRDTFNVADAELQPNSADAETSSDTLDFLSNGFKLRNTGSAKNGSGTSHIYMCFAEQPLTGTNGVPCTAR